MNKDKVMEVVKKSLGENFVFVSYEDKGRYATVIWKDSKEDDFSFYTNVGINKYGKYTEISGGEV